MMKIGGERENEDQENCLQLQICTAECRQFFSTYKLILNICPIKDDKYDTEVQECQRKL